ncbi:MAG: glycosyltransferase family A protein [Bacteriovorax sp.]|nr:glycosyltransferase family A protein [Bacteriovorax sp.]
MNTSLNNSEILVSVIVPTYNHAHLIKKALTSLIEQTHQNWEALVVNNYSEDNTIEVIESFQDKRINVINFHNNGSIAASRNVGIKESKAPYIAFLDSDDYWYPKKLEKCLNKIITDNADLCVNSEIIISNKKPIKPLICGNKEQLTYFHLLFRGNCISTSSVLMKKNCIDHVGGFNEDSQMITAEDYDLWLRIAKKNYRFTHVDEILGGHLQHSSNSSSFVEKHHKAIVNVLEKYLQEFPNNFKTSVNKRIRYANLFYETGRNATRQKQFSDSMSFYLKSFKNNPFKIKTYPAVLISLFKQLKKSV